MKSYGLVLGGFFATCQSTGDVAVHNGDVVALQEAIGALNAKLEAVGLVQTAAAPQPAIRVIVPHAPEEPAAKEGDIEGRMWFGYPAGNMKGEPDVVTEKEDDGIWFGYPPGIPGKGRSAQNPKAEMPPKEPKVHWMGPLAQGSPPIGAVVGHDKEGKLWFGYPVGDWMESPDTTNPAGNDPQLFEAPDVSKTPAPAFYWVKPLSLSMDPPAGVEVGHDAQGGLWWGYPLKNAPVGDGSVGFDRDGVPQAIVIGTPSPQNSEAAADTTAPHPIVDQTQSPVLAAMSTPETAGIFGALKDFLGKLAKDEKTQALDGVAVPKNGELQSAEKRDAEKKVSEGSEYKRGEHRLRKRVDDLMVLFNSQVDDLVRDDLAEALDKALDDLQSYEVRAAAEQNSRTPSPALPEKPAVVQQMQAAQSVSRESQMRAERLDALKAKYASLLNSKEPAV
eukprot:Gregarina_sp_Poly_1__4154@NODE_2273_length_2372_cov_1101_643384_g1419_i1_p1_GENE_NODE_2273_length_2372_cov_1101_643384_g1419_i1NODE_2273_length_2372_cov_1101_643384_g1419_i1_p1_ORF_typecomplete_len448_score98_05EspA/PF03433_13/2e03EspA/PF03433_13/0_097MbeD_MobD/PF04899_12/5_2MbeD_MobD/PF04899_12/1_1e02Reg_prop/PF07494_11/1_2e02Reg_prop/PF07494_11/3_3e03Reg_prop/PF07494_11/3_1Reg_prop/PF07494_11/6_6e03_NODE_2273_length_2372_cov_1101_643384_g1419_i18622205